MDAIDAANPKCSHPDGCDEPALYETRGCGAACALHAGEAALAPRGPHGREPEPGDCVVAAVDRPSGVVELAPAARLVAVDFDGVLHDYQSGWRGAAEVPDPPVPGAIEWLASLLRDPRLEVAISSARSCEPGGREAMRGWLLSRGLAPELVARIAWPTEKPAAHVTVDDRALTFRGAFPSADELHGFRPWWREARDARPRRAYVACASAELERAERAVARLRALGVEVTYDWTRDLREQGCSDPADRAVAERCARADLAGVAAADVVLVLEGAQSYGRVLEYGAALALGKPVVVSGAPGGRIWETLDWRRVADDEEAAIVVASAPLPGARARDQLAAARTCEYCGAQSRVTTAGCDHRGAEDE